MIGLIGNEFITIYTPKEEEFLIGMIIWTIIWGDSFYFLHVTIQNNGPKKL